MLFGRPPTLLQAADVSYLGSYTVDTGTNHIYGRGIAVRHVSGSVRLLFATYVNSSGPGPVKEFSLAGKSYGDTVNSASDSWTTSGLVQNWSDGTVPHVSLNWDEANSRLWWQQAVDYDNPVTPYATNIQTMTLGSGVVANVKTFSLQGVPDRRAYSGMVTVPSAIQSSLGIGPFVVGLGGYTSLESAGGECAMGFSAYAIPDPYALSDGAVILSSTYKVLGARGHLDRGKRIWYNYTFTPTTTIDLSAYGYSSTTPAGTFSGKGPVNFGDSGDPRPNPSTAPTFQPVAAASFQSPDGSGDAVWPQQNGKYCGGFWPATKGLCLVGNFPTGRVYYQSSSGRCDSETAEIHVFDPAQIAQVIAATRDPDDIEPVVMIPLPDVDHTNLDGAFGGMNAAFDPVDSRLYIYCHDWTDAFSSKLHVYQVSA